MYIRQLQLFSLNSQALSVSWLTKFPLFPKFFSLLFELLYIFHLEKFSNCHVIIHVWELHFPSPCKPESLYFNFIYKWSFDSVDKFKCKILRLNIFKILLYCFLTSGVFHEKWKSDSYPIVVNLVVFTLEVFQISLLILRTENIGSTGMSPIWISRGSVK